MRTVDEIKAYYEELREAFKRTDSNDDDWVGEPIKEAWLLLDRISALEARCAELERDSADTLIEDLEQDVIGEMATHDVEISDADMAWNTALDWVLERLKTYRKE